MRATCRAIFLPALLATATAIACAQVVVNAFPRLSFRQPIFLTHSQDTTDRIFVVQQTGLIRVFPNDSNAAAADTFLNIGNLVSATSGEEGLLGLAFHPQYQQNGYFFVDYTAPNPLRTVIERFTTLTGNANRADPASGHVVLEILQPFTNHNGGMLAFGADGYLYIGMGDGGSGGDPFNNAQNLDTLLGKILRIDIDDTAGGKGYGIPPDNPYAGNLAGHKEEIWAYGLRNPWRYSFDPVTGQLWAGDVGQDSREEVDIIRKGRNYGWRLMEGFSCYNPPSGCDTTGLTLPIIDYDHSLGIAITGGYVYRGSRRPDLYGAYIYGDYGSGRIWELQYANGQVLLDSLMTQLPSLISSFGVDRNNELYIVTYSGSSNTGIYRFGDSSTLGAPAEPPPGLPAHCALMQNYPNPFNPFTTIDFFLPDQRRVVLTVVDVIGRTIATLANGPMPAGIHEVQFDGSGLSSGMYFYRLRAGDFVATRKLLLLR